MRRTTAALAGAVGSLLLAASAAHAAPATLTVDDDRQDCPAAQFTSIQAAVDAATATPYADPADREHGDQRDTIAICPGTYAEGSGAVGTNALTITKSVKIKGAGAGLVTITPKATTLTGGRILEDAPSIRNGVGDIVAIDGTPARPLTVDLSGVTVDGHDAIGRAIAVEAGIVFLDAKGRVERTHVTNVVTSEGDNAYTVPGGWRGTQPGIGIAQTSNALTAPVDGARTLTIERTRVDKYNQAGILVDGASNDAAPFAASGAVDSAVVTGSQVVGRTECVNYQGTGNCSSVGLLTTGPLFGQDGIRVTNNSRVKVTNSLISQNLVNGSGAPARSTVSTAGVVTANTTNNANLPLGAGIRLIAAGLTQYASATGQVLLSYAADSNITDNAYGVVNVAADGTTARGGDLTPPANTGIGDVFEAENNWWGLNYYRTTNPGPSVSPTANPPVPETAVTGTTATDADGNTLTSVDFTPYRSGVAADMSNGEWPVLSAPLPVDDAPPVVTLSAPATVARGTTLALGATAGDDFGVKAVTFYDGTVKLGTATLPGYAATEAIAAGAACGAHALSAVAEDSLGQTTISRATVTVTGCDAPPPPDGGGTTPPPPAPAAPSIALSRLTAAVKAAGATVTLTPVAEAGVKQVEVFLGTRRVCTLTAAPWTCRVVPTGADVGAQVLRAVITDQAGQTAQATEAIRVAKFAPRGLSVAIASTALKHGAVRKTIKGRVLLPKGVTARQGCTGGAATIVVRRAGRSVSNSQVKVSAACAFTKRVTAPRVKAGSKAFTYSIRFTGTDVLAAASTTRRTS